MAGYKCIFKKEAPTAHPPTCQPSLLVFGTLELPVSFCAGGSNPTGSSRPFPDLTSPRHQCKNHRRRSNISWTSLASGTTSLASMLRNEWKALGGCLVGVSAMRLKELSGRDGRCDEGPVDPTNFKSLRNKYVPPSDGSLCAARHAKMAAHPYQGSGPSAQPAPNAMFPQQPQVSDMDANSRQLRRRDGALSAFNTAIEAMNLAKEVSGVTPAKAVFGSVSVLLTMIRVRFSSLRICSKFTCDQDSMANKADYVELGLTCANVCKALDRGMNGKRLDEISQSVSDAITQLTM